MAIAASGNKVKKNAGRGASFFGNIKNLDLKININKQISSREIIFFTNQLSLMTEIGMSLNIGLSLITKQIKNPEFKEVLTGVTSRVEEGELLSDALGRYPHIFSNIYISLVKAGENTGQMKEMLDRIVEMQEKREKFVAGIKKSLTYPAILCTVSVAVVIFLLVYVFPRFATLFQDIYDLLPVTTKVLIFLSNGLTSYWKVCAVTLAIICWGAYTFIKSNKGKQIIHKLQMSLPLLANIYIKIFLTQTLRTLGFLMGSNVPLIEALRIVKEGARNLLFARFIDKIVVNIEEGKGMSLAFSESTFVPENAKQIIKTGEETQNLPKVMLRLSDYYEGEIDDQMKNLSTIIEPALLIVMGLVVGVIVISLILPIFKLSKAVH